MKKLLFLLVFLNATPGFSHDTSGGTSANVGECCTWCANHGDRRAIACISAQGVNRALDSKPGSKASKNPAEAGIAR
jgi:hypothetical protein